MANRFFGIKVSHGTRTIFVAVTDAVLTTASFLTALLLRFDSDTAWQFRDQLPQLLLLLVACRLACGLFFRLHRWSFRLSGLADGARVAMATVSGTALFVLLLVAAFAFVASTVSGRWLGGCGKGPTRRRAPCWTPTPRA